MLEIYLPICRTTLLQQKMAATSLPSSSGINIRPAISTKLFISSNLSCTFCSTTRGSGFRISAKLGGGEEEAKKGGKKKFITKEQEPEQYYRTAGEREGENPMKTPLPWIIIFGMSTPFVILGIAFANGWIKVPIR